MSPGVCPLSAPDAGTARSVPETENWDKVRITEYIAVEIMSGTDSGFAVWDAHGSELQTFNHRRQEHHEGSGAYCAGEKIKNLV